MRAGQRFESARRLSPFGLDKPNPPDEGEPQEQAGPGEFHGLLGGYKLFCLQISDSRLATYLLGGNLFIGEPLSGAEVQHG
jgi:hypothetical protein